MSERQKRLSGMRLVQVVAGTLLLAACTNDYNGFVTTGGEADASVGGSGGSAGTGGTGGTAGQTGTGGTAGEAGTGGSGCGLNQKRCGSSCVPVDDPATGCSAASCDPCALDHAVAACSAGGDCAVGSCADGFGNCDNNDANGCEADTASDPSHCGSCANACPTSPTGAFDCVDSLCLCGEQADCQTDDQTGFVGCGTPATTGAVGHCLCSAATCNIGEQCARVGSGQRCRCNGGDKCAFPQACCTDGCHNLYSDEQNCGACGRVCPAGTTCNVGTCG